MSELEKLRAENARYAKLIEAIESRSEGDFDFVIFLINRFKVGKDND